MAESKYLKKVQGNGASTTLSASMSAVATSASLTADTAFAGEGMVIIDEGTATEEFAYATAKVGSALTTLAGDRGLEGGSAQAHAGTATVKGIITAGMWNNLITGVTNVLVNTTGALDTTKVVDLTTAQNLSNKTFVAPILGTPASGVMTNVTGTATGLTAGITNALKSATTTVDVSAATAPSTGQILTATDSTHATWQSVGGADGWTAAGTFTYASASTITVASGAAAIYAVGDRLKWTQTTVKYGVIVAVADTLLTIAVNTDYTVANAAITLPYYSHQANPLGYPANFAYTPTWTADSGVNPAIVNGTITGVFSIVGRDCNVNIRVSMGGSSTYGSGGTAYRLSLPVGYASSSYTISGGIYKDSSAATNDTYGYGEPAATTYINLRRTGGNYTYTTTPFTWATNDEIIFSGTYKI